MTTAEPPDDADRSTIVSRSPGLAYQRTREALSSHFDQSAASRLTYQGALLVALAAALALASAGGAPWRAAATSVPALASGPSVAALGAVACALLASGATVHAAVAAYRLRREPLAERRALALVCVEDAASYLGLGVGGALTLATVAVVTTGLGGDAVPTTATAPATTAALATAAAVAAALALAAGVALRGRLPRSGVDRPRFFSRRAE